MLRRTWGAHTLARVLVGAVVVALSATGGWWFGSRDAAAATTAGPTTTTQTVAASLTTLEKTVTATGTLAPAVQEDVSFAVSGTVTSVPVTEGQAVTAGQTLATVDTLQLDADLLSAKASLATAKATLADAKTADDGSTAADAQIASDTAQVALAQIKVDSASEAVAGATLVAPVDGLITTASLAVGDVVSGSSGSTGATGAGAQGASTTTTSSTGQFVIIGTDAWVVSATVGESDVALISVGDQVEITVDGATAAIFGTVSEIGLISSSSGGVAAYPVTVAVTGQQTGLHDGVSADLSIVYERRADVLTVPAAAIRTVDGQTVVTQTDASGAEVSTPVTTGESSGSSTEIVSGLAEGDEVVMTVVTRSSSGTGTGTSGGSGDVPQMPQGFDPAQGGGFPGGPANG